MNKILKYIFNISVLFLIIISLWPGSLIGFLFYGDWGQQPDLIKNPYGTTINHFVYYLYISLLGFFIYIKDKNFISKEKLIKISDIIIIGAPHNIYKKINFKKKILFNIWDHNKNY